MTPSSTAARWRKPFVAFIVLALAACKSDVTTPGVFTGTAPDGVAILFLAGNGETGATGHALRVPVEVEVATAVAGADSVTVTFTAHDSGSVSPATFLTDVNGNARTIWTLGPRPGPETLTVSVTTQGGSVISANDLALGVTDTGLPATALIVYSGDAQLGAVSQQLAQPLIVAATDSFGVGVPGVNVAFTSGGDSQIIGGTAGNGLPVTTMTTLTTDANGQASIKYQLGSTLGLYGVQAQATIAGAPATVFFGATAQNGPDQAAIADLFAGRGPQGVTLDAANGTIYVANTGQPLACDFAPTQLGGFNSYAAISQTQDALITTQGTGTQPFYAAANASTGMLYVAGTPSLEVWNAATNTRVTTLNLADSLHQLAINPGANQIWVAASVAHAAIVINGATSQVAATVKATVKTGKLGPHGIAIDVGANRVYTSDSASQTVTVIDAGADTVITHIAIGANASGIAVDSLAHRIFVSTGSPQSSLIVIDGTTNTVLTTIAVGRRLGELAVDANNHIVYGASASLPYSVAVFDGTKNQLIGFHPTATRCPYGVAFDHSTGRVYVTSYIDGNLFVLNASKLP